MSEAAVQPAADKRAQVAALLADTLRMMEYPATLDFKDMPDGGIGVAVHFKGELPGITPGKRTYLVDCLQFLVNKVVNRPNTERRWVTLGVDAFPEPRGTKPEGAAPPPANGAAKPEAAKAAAKPAGKGNDAKAKPDAPPRPPPPPKVDEASLQVAPDPVMTAVVTALAEKSAKLGRTYALMMLSTDDRARAVSVVKTVKGVSPKVEGEGHWRRVTLLPEKPVAMPKKSAVMPDYDEEE